MADSEDPSDFTSGALCYMKRAAPERAVALQKLFDDHVVRVRHTSLDQFRQGEVVDPSPSALWGVIQFPPIMHTLAWLLIHGGWEAMRNYGAAIISFQMVGAGFSGAAVEAALTRYPDTARCTEVIDCAVRNVQGTEVSPPSWLPNINGTASDPETNRQYDAVRELWFIAQCWFLLHELQHILFQADGKEFSDRPQEELACDTKATSWLLDGVEFYSKEVKEAPDKVRGKRAMGMLVGLFCIGWLSPPSGSASHPPLQGRLRILLEQVGALDAARFWDFAVGLLFALSKDRNTIQFSANATMRDIALLLADTI
jgi:hypothetical protein